MLEARLVVSGLVQGVFYRASVKKAAETLRLAGFVRNLPDGRVEIIVQGSERELKEFERQCYTASRAARVERVEAQFREPGKRYRNFIIK